MIIDAISPLGRYIDYSISKRRRNKYLDQWAPKDISRQLIAKTFKKDIFIDCILEEIEDVTLYYLVSNEERGDELYYFSKGDRFFHGERVWSAYHSFVPALARLHPSCTIDEPCYFVGSRNNYTHQLVDFSPNLFYRIVMGDDIRIPSECVNIFGRPNQILEEILKHKTVAPYICSHGGSLYLSDIGVTSILPGWSVKCIRFKRLYLIRHMSIFLAFHLVREFMCNPISPSNISSSRKSILFLERPDKRVANQDELVTYLRNKWHADSRKNIHQISYAQKQEIFSSYDLIILPPGSDNINGFCFSGLSCKFIQLSPVEASDLLRNPFLSYASMRYCLPFLHRTDFLPAKPKGQNGNLLSGSWETSRLESLIYKALAAYG